MASIVLPWECGACKTAWAATVEVEDPDSLINERDRALMRRLREDRQRLAESVGVVGPPPGDPVLELERELLERFGRDQLRFATCPACGAKNPEGVAVQRSRTRVRRWVVSSLLAAVAAASYFHPPVALFIPIATVLSTVVVALARRRAGRPIAGWRCGILVAVATGAAALVVLLPRFAFLVPILACLDVLRVGTADDPFATASRTIRMQAGAYRT